MTDSVFFRNLAADAYTEANNRNVFAGANNNVLIPGFDAVDAPIMDIQRSVPVIRGGTTQLPVTLLDPRANNEATTSVAMAPDDGFFTPVAYRGAFGPDEVWLRGWSASDEFGFLAGPAPAAPATCKADINGDGMVGFNDLTALLGAWGTDNPKADLDLNGDVGFSDLTTLLGLWGPCSC